MLVDLATFKQYLGVNRGDDPDADALLQTALDSATDGICESLSRTIAVADTVASPRGFASTVAPELFIDDCTTVTSITSIDANWGSSWASTTPVVLADGVDYQLEPVAHRARSGSYRPYSSIRRRRGWSDSGGFTNVTVTATWGWATVPPAVVEAVKILGKDIVANRDVSFGIAAFTQYAGIRARENPQIWQRIQPYSLHVGVY